MSESSEAPVAFFRERFGVDDRSLERTLGAALERRVDGADLFFEYTTQDQVVLEEGIVKGGDRVVEQGAGVRVQTGERQGYAHSDEITVDSLLSAATTARAVCEQSGEASVAIAARAAGGLDLYPVATRPTEVPIERKVSLLEEIDAYARSRDGRIKQVMANVVTQDRQVLIATSDGSRVGDARPLVRLNVQVIAADATGSRREIGYQGMGGRYELEQAAVGPSLAAAGGRGRAYSRRSTSTPSPAPPAPWTWSSARLAGHPAPRGDRPRPRGRLQPQADLRLHRPPGRARRVSPASPSWTTAPSPPGRGSLNVDDEGTPTQRTVLIEDGILVRLPAGQAERPAHGHGSRRATDAARATPTCPCRA